VEEPPSAESGDDEPDGVDEAPHATDKMERKSVSAIGVTKIVRMSATSATRAPSRNAVHRVIRACHQVPRAIARSQRWRA
jgi:hypothetical protein